MALKFLLIDDDPDDRELFCEAIYAADPQITCYSAAGGRKALSKLETQEIALPDMIFLDINMPGMDGWQCLSILQKHEMYKQIPVVIYSTTSHPEDMQKATDSGALCFFTKPPSYKDLKKSMELVIKHLNGGSLHSLAEILPYSAQYF